MSFSLPFNSSQLQLESESIELEDDRHPNGTLISDILTILAEKSDFELDQDQSLFADQINNDRETPDFKNFNQQLPALEEFLKSENNLKVLKFFSTLYRSFLNDFEPVSNLEKIIFTNSIYHNNVSFTNAEIGQICKEIRINQPSFLPVLKPILFQMAEKIESIDLHKAVDTYEKIYDIVPLDYRSTMAMLRAQLCRLNINKIREGLNQDCLWEINEIQGYTEGIQVALEIFHRSEWSGSFKTKEVLNHIFIAQVEMAEYFAALAKVGYYGDRTYRNRGKTVSHNGHEVCVMSHTEFLDEEIEADLDETSKPGIQQISRYLEIIESEVEKLGDKIDLGFYFSKMPVLYAYIGEYTKAFELLCDGLSRDYGSKNKLHRKNILETAAAVIDLSKKATLEGLTLINELRDLKSVLGFHPQDFIGNAWLLGEKCLNLADEIIRTSFSVRSFAPLNNLQRRIHLYNDNEDENCLTILNTIYNNERKKLLVDDNYLVLECNTRAALSKVFCKPEITKKCEQFQLKTGLNIEAEEEEVKSFLDSHLRLNILKDKKINSDYKFQILETFPAVSKDGETLKIYALVSISDAKNHKWIYTNGTNIYNGTYLQPIQTTHPVLNLYEVSIGNDRTVTNLFYNYYSSEAWNQLLHSWINRQYSHGENCGCNTIKSLIPPENYLKMIKAEIVKLPELSDTTKSYFASLGEDRTVLDFKRAELLTIPGVLGIEFYFKTENQPKVLCSCNLSINQFGKVLISDLNVLEVCHKVPENFFEKLRELAEEYNPNDFFVQQLLKADRRFLKIDFTGADLIANSRITGLRVIVPFSKESEITFSCDLELIGQTCTAINNFRYVEFTDDEDFSP